MTSLYIRAVYDGIAIICLCGAIFYVYKAIRNDKNFYFALISCGLLCIICIFSLITQVIDILSYQQGRFSSAHGVCEVHIERTYRQSPNYEIHINGLELKSRNKSLSSLKGESFPCKVTYLSATKTLIDFEFK